MPVPVSSYSAENASAKESKPFTQPESVLHPADAPQGVIAAKGQDVQRIVDETIGRIKQQSDW